ncbi:MAG: glycosyltransferase family 4 protein [Acidobacteria bacterium]|nr:glycosyltransferase family 4 protein [Acidobacteriota bacterium]
MPATKPAILHINTEKGFRGGEIQTLETAKRLQAMGFPTIMLCHKDGLLLEKSRKANLKALEFSPKGEIDIFSALKLRKIVKEHSVDIVHCHTSHALGIAYLSAVRNKGVKVVGTRRVSFRLRSRWSLKKYLAASKIVTVSESIAKELYDRGVPAEKLAVIHSGIDVSRFKNLPDQSLMKERLGISKNYPVIGVVGALAHHKGHKTLLKAISRAWITFPNTIVVFVGEGSAKEDLQKSVASKALPALFLGFVENVAPIYKSFDLFVLPSISGEGSPAVIKEAAAAGVPVIATAVGGIDEILRNNQEALIVPPSDPEKLAKAIITVLKDNDLRARLVEAAKKRVELFDFKAVAEGYEKLYLDLFKR